MVVMTTPDPRPAPRTRRSGRDPLAWLLAFVVVLQFGYPVTQYGEGWTAGYMLAYAGMIFFGLLSVHRERLRVFPLYLPGAAFVVCGTWFSVDQTSRSATMAMLVTVALFMAVLIASLLRFVFRRSSAPGGDLVMAAVVVYLMLGGLFAATFAITEILSPGSFADPLLEEGPLGWQRLLYFSYVTLATLGYGDILPLTAWSRSLVTFAAVSGTLFLTVVVARLVAIWSSVDAAAGSGPDRHDHGS